MTTLQGIDEGYEIIFVPDIHQYVLVVPSHLPCCCIMQETCQMCDRSNIACMIVNTNQDQEEDAVMCNQCINEHFVVYNKYKDQMETLYLKQRLMKTENEIRSLKQEQQRLSATSSG